MERTITIDGRQVRFKSTGAFLLRYKAQFGRDAMQDLLKLSQALDTETGEVTNLDALDLEVFFNLAWTLAKTADPGTPDPFTWLDTFDSFPLDEVLPQVSDLLLASIQGTKKK
jgi:hypothetical protein